MPLQHGQLVKLKGVTFLAWVEEPDRDDKHKVVVKSVVNGDTLSFREDKLELIG